MVETVWDWTVPPGYVGNDIYNNTGAGQILSKPAERRVTRDFWVRIYNELRASHVGRSTFTLHANRAPQGSTVRYYRGRTDITTALRSCAGMRILVDSRWALWSYSELGPIRIEITPGPRAVIGSRTAAVVTATWKGDRVLADTVKQSSA